MIMLAASILSLALCFPAQAYRFDLTYEFDGNSLGTVVFGTVDISQNSNNNDLDFVITADTTSLVGFRQ